MTLDTFGAEPEVTKHEGVPFSTYNRLLPVRLGALVEGHIRQALVARQFSGASVFNHIYW